MAVVLLIFLNVFEGLVVVDVYLAIDMIPLLASVVVTADPHLAVEELLILLKVHLLAIVAILLLVVSRCAQIAEPEGLIVRILLARPEASRLSAIRYILFGTNNVFAASQLLLGCLLYTWLF